MPIPAQGILINPDSVSQPKKIIVATTPMVISARLNCHRIPDTLNVISVDNSKLKKIRSGEGDKNFLLVNSTGDTLLSGIKIPAHGKKVRSFQPESKTALPLRMKENAVADINYLDVDQGMNSSYVNCMIEDQSGNIWFGTKNGGVSKYDGQSFTHFTEEEGLSNKIVWSILEDKSGNIWFGTSGGGVSKYDGQSFTHFTEKEGLSNNYIRCIFEDKSGNLWFGTNGKGVTKYNGSEMLSSGSGSFTHFTIADGLSNNTVWCITEDQSGNIWFGTDGGGATKYDGEFFTHFTEADGLSNNSVMSIVEDKYGNIWFATYGGGVSKLFRDEADKQYTFVHFTENEGLSNNIVISAFEDKSGNLWFGTNGAGVSKYDPSEKSRTGSEFFRHITESEGLSNNIVRSILEDQAGNIWLGTSGGGVSVYDVNSFVHFTKKEGLQDDFVWSILEDRSGNIWFGTNSGVSKYDPNEKLRTGSESFTQFTTAEGMSNNLIMSILEDRNGNIWFASNGDGVTKYDPSEKLRAGSESFTHYRETEGLSFNYIRSILEDRSGNIWFGTNGRGVTKYTPSPPGEGGTFTHFTDTEGLSSNIIWSIIEDKHGNIWFGTHGGGVTKYTPPVSGKEGTFTHFTEAEGLSNNIVWSILEDKSGNLWFGTNGGGISKYDPSEKLRTGSESFVNYTEAEGLSNNAVHSILEDQAGNIWVSTAKGISRIHVAATTPDEKKLIPENGAGTVQSNAKLILSLSKQDGLKGVDFYQNSAFLDSKNNIWWGSGKGLEMLDLNTYNISDKTPKVKLRSLDIRERFLDYRNLSDSAKGEIKYSAVAPFENYPLNLELPYNQNHLTFHYSAIDWAAPHKLKYQYKLMGLDEKWSPVTENTAADYRNIPYGTFTFIVRAIGESQIWGEPFEYTFTILPPWWQTWWFRVLLAFTFVSVLYLLYRSRTAALRARQKQLEKTVEDRTLELKLEKELVEEKHKEITDSINYAGRIQRSFLATKDLLDENLKDYFVLFQPKDVVSGDFYWATKLGNGNFALVTADSTGHGVPGAIMSILNISSLEKSVEIGLTNPAEIFNHTRKTIIDRLKKDGSREGGKDGMDASLVCFDFTNKKFLFAASNNPIWIIRNQELIELNPDKMPVGKHDKDQIPFSQSEFQIQTGDIVYTFTDGLPDQFGGEKGKKFMHKRLKELLLSIASDSMEIQKGKLNTAFFDWKGDLEQVDDVCVIGVRI